MGLNIQDLAISSPDVADQGAIDARFAADTGNETPRIEISGVPAEAVELAVILHDPDAPLPNGFTHWVVYGIDPSSTSFGGGVEVGKLGPNTMGEAVYSGPQPPPGHGLHHYYFWVYALDRPVEGTPSREEFLRDYADAIVEQNRLVGTYHQ